jgi:hypothetical protein
VTTALTGSGIDIDMRLGTVNSTKYGGCGGQWAVWSAGNASAREIAVHEVGHSFSKLADEYFSPGNYTGGELSEWNATNSNTSGKWDRWVGYNDPSSNIGPIGYYQGGRYFEQGIYRPSDNSKMRNLNRPFDAISREKIINDIYAEVDPLDAWTNNSGTLIDPSTLMVDTVDPNVIKVQWFVDGTAIANLGESLNLASLGLAAGDHQVRARAYDGILDFSFTGGAQDWWRLGTQPLEQSITWNITLTAVPEPSSLVLLLVVGCMVGLRSRSKEN